jgi:5-methylcytosine-specific restriction endonuclease McrA
MAQILVLNHDYSPLNITTLKRGFKLVFKGKAEVINHDINNPIETSVKTFRRPTVIRLLRYIYLPFKKVPLSRFNIYRRDNHRCIYCGNKKDLTLDHVIPKSKGGKNTWRNLVTCCGKCNVSKGDMSLQDFLKMTGYKMAHKPYVPNYIQFIEKIGGKMRDEWRPFLFIS